MICEEILWFQFQGVMEHTDHHTKKLMKLIHISLKYLYACNKDFMTKILIQMPLVLNEKIVIKLQLTNNIMHN